MNPKPMQKIAKTEQAAFLRQLKGALVEKDVETAYKAIFQRYYQTTFPSPYGSDGFIEPNQQSLLEDNLHLLLEVKFHLDLTKANERAKIIAQTIYYLKKFEQDGRKLPNVIMGGDENQLFTIYAPKLYHYLERDFDWGIAPSSAWEQNEELYRNLVVDPNLNVYVFDFDTSGFDINEVFQSINSLASQRGDFHKLFVTESNLRLVFDEFTRLVFSQDNWLNSIKKVGGAPEAVSIFITSILGNPEVYIVPTKKNMLRLASGKEVKINANNYDAFFSRYDRRYTANEIDKITAVADQLIEELDRRFHGDFWTPTIWANRAVEMMDQNLGGSWRDEYIVWDPAAGTKNLTRDHKFKNLFSSTIHQSEIDMSAQYNKDATVFQYDFLNDDIDINPKSDPRDLKIPFELFDALKNNKPIVFYTNPPYGQATNSGAKGTHKAGIARTGISNKMQQQDFGHATLELYTQFLYRITKLTVDFNLTNVKIFFFTQVFLTSPAFGKFNDYFFNKFCYKDGFLLNAGEFQGTSSNWGIIFSYFQLDTKITSRQLEFQYSVEQSGKNGVEILGEHTYSQILGSESISSWLREIPLPKKEFKSGKYPQMSGAFSISSGRNPRGRLCEGALGYMVNNADTVMESDQTVSLQSTAAYRANGTSVIPENFERACVTFASRKSILVDASWINWKDVFRRPSREFQSSIGWNEFTLDSVIYSLFNQKSYQTSLRDFEYNGEEYNVYNEWFFMARDEITVLATKHLLNDIVYDARSSEDRFVYNYLSGRSLSREASDLLSAGRELIESTFSKRFLADQEHPEWHLMTWDAGYYQAYKITTMFKKDFIKEVEKLNQARSLLEAKIRSQVYHDKILEK